MLDQLPSAVKSAIITDRSRDIQYYRRLIQLVIALCALIYEWRTGEKAPKARDVL